MEDFGARARQASDYCRDKVRECDLLVGVVGYLYGSCPDGSEKSYSEIEYDAAAPENRLMFLVDAVAQPPGEMSAVESEDQRRRLQAFRSRIEQTAIRTLFKEPNELATSVLAAIKNWENESPTRMVAALPALMRDPDVRSAILGSRDQFDHTAEQIDRIADFKSVHDVLHTLQFNCLNMLIQKSARFDGHDPDLLAELENYANTLDADSKKLIPLVSGKTFEGQERSWLEAIDNARAELRGAIEHSDKQRLDKAVRYLNRAVAKLPRVNRALIEGVRNLDLKQLLSILSRIRDKLSSLKLEDEVKRKFEHGLASLENLEQRLTTLTSAHDQWQEVETELRLIEDQRDAYLDQLKVSWPALKGMTTSFLSDHDLFAQLTSKVDVALVGEDEKTIRNAFRSYRSRAGTEFFGVDTDLLRVCEDLRKLGNPLRSVLELR